MARLVCRPASKQAPVLAEPVSDEQLVQAVAALGLKPRNVVRLNTYLRHCGARKLEGSQWRTKVSGPLALHKTEIGKLRTEIGRRNSGVST
jgi:hypothetical protein